MSGDTLLYVVLQKDCSNKHLEGLPDNYPARCTRVGPAQLPPTDKHAIMSAVEVEALQESMRGEYHLWRHRSNREAKSADQIAVALAAHPEDEKMVNDFALGAAVRHGLDLGKDTERAYAVRAGYNRLQRMRSGEEAVSPTVDDLQLQLEAMAQQLADARAALQAQDLKKQERPARG